MGSGASPPSARAGMAGAASSPAQARASEAAQARALRARRLGTPGRRAPAAPPPGRRAESPRRPRGRRRKRADPARARAGAWDALGADAERAAGGMASSMFALRKGEPGRTAPTGAGRSGAPCEGATAAPAAACEEEAGRPLLPSGTSRMLGRGPAARSGEGRDGKGPWTPPEARSSAPLAGAWARCSVFSGVLPARPAKMPLARAGESALPPPPDGRGSQRLSAGCGSLGCPSAAPWGAGRISRDAWLASFPVDANLSSVPRERRIGRPSRKAAAMAGSRSAIGSPRGAHRAFGLAPPTGPRRCAEAHVMPGNIARPGNGLQTSQVR